MTTADALRIARATGYQPMRGIKDPIRTLDEAFRDLAEQRAKETTEPKECK